MQGLATIQPIDNIERGHDTFDVLNVNFWKFLPISKYTKYTSGSERVIFVKDRSIVPEEIVPEDHPIRRLVIRQNNKGPFHLTPYLSHTYFKSSTKGMVLPISILPSDRDYKVGEDVTELLGISASAFKSEVFNPYSDITPPPYCHHIDIPFVEDLPAEAWRKKVIDGVFDITELPSGLDVGVCLSSEQGFQVYTKFGAILSNNSLFELFATNFGLRRDLERFKLYDLAFHFTLVGPGIEGNRYGVFGVRAYLNSIFDIGDNEYLPTFLFKSMAGKLSVFQSPMWREGYVINYKDPESLIGQVESSSKDSIKLPSPNLSNFYGIAFRNQTGENSFGSSFKILNWKGFRV